MRISHNRHFSYCLNVHPGERLADIYQALQQEVPVIQSALCSEKPFGLGLRIARDAATELKKPEVFNEFSSFLTDQNLYAFTINGFPYGAFHNTRVKEKVYLPDWSDPARLQYTCDLFDILSGLLPEGVEGSVSTVPLAYRPPGHPLLKTTADFATLDPHFFHQLSETALHLSTLEKETGRYLHLGLEPEPDCLLETTDQAVTFFETLIQKSPVDEQTLRRYLGLCVDTCHVAMQFEDPAESIQKLVAAGMKISKIQISAALECDSGLSPSRLQPFDDGVYLHQVKSSTGQSLRDLPLWLSNSAPLQGVLRIHAHVPLHWPGNEHLRTTRPTLTHEFWKAAEASGCPHFEVETYTFDVLPEAVRNNISVAEDMIQECRWALERV